MRKILRSKIHRATVTHANLNYEGSVTIPPELMKSADILPYEAVSIWDVTNGSRLETYAIPGVRGAGEICINGAAAHLISPKDVVILAVFTYLDDRAAKKFKPRIVFVDKKNKQVFKGKEIAGPRLRRGGK